MKIGFGNIFTYFYSPLFWTFLFILCTSFTQTEDVATKDTPATIQQNLSTNYSTEKKTILASSTTSSGISDTLVDNINLKSEDVVQPSFTEQSKNSDPSPPTEFEFSEVASQNAGISNEISDAGQIAITLIDSATADLQQRVEKSSQAEEETAVTNSTIITEKSQETSAEENTTSINNAEEQVQENKPLIEVPKVEPKENLTEEIPSFSEWAQKQLEEAEKKREEVNSSSHHQTNGKSSNNNKVRSKNYASPDCGAKIVAANPEAISPSSVLSPSRDEYKLNTCTSRIWFIVELCEAIQAKKIDLANFELFSSSPKDFSVYVSDRFPSREWSNVGQFAAKDERDIQSFDLHPHLFGKYIKVEMHSHHGSEHFCPISLFRVYGTSEFEVLEKEDQLHTDDDDDDDTVDSEKRPGPQNLFSSATDAVISIVKKAAEVLGNNKGNSTEENTNEAENKESKKYSPLINTCTTPSHIVVCNNCSDLMFGKVYELLSCRSTELHNLLSSSFIRKSLYNSSICMDYGFDFQSKIWPKFSNAVNSYVKTIFHAPYLAALCNSIAMIENKVVLNVSNQVNMTEKEIAIENNISIKLEQQETLNNDLPIINSQKGNNESELTTEYTVSTNEDISNTDTEVKIKPTKTMTQEEMIEMTQFSINDSDGNSGDQDTVKSSTAPSIVDELNNIEMPKEHVEDTSEPNDTSVPTDEEPTTESNEHLDLDHLINDYDNTNNNNYPANSATPTPPKESVFLRLSNRIKTLERNMSLSSQYLEELSRRYKKQVEEMQRLLEKTITTFNEESKKKDERNDRLEAKLNQLTEVVEALVAERDNTFNPFHWFILIVVTTIGIFTFCRRNDKHFINNSTMAEVQRRKSIDVVNHNTPIKRERRPSEEALKIIGTYEHLLLDDADTRIRTRERKRKRKKGMLRSNSITTLSEEHQNKPWTYAHNPQIPSSLSWKRQASAPAKAPANWNASISINLDEAPIVLEESDNNPLQDMPLPKPLQEKEITNGNALNVKVPLRKISSPAFLKAVESRKPQNGYLDIIDMGHKKSASVDETKRHSSPTPSTGNISLNLDNVKKEKKVTLKKILKKVF